MKVFDPFPILPLSFEMCYPKAQLLNGTTEKLVTPGFLVLQFSKCFKSHVGRTTMDAWLSPSGQTPQTHRIQIKIEAPKSKIHRESSPLCPTPPSG